MRLIPQHARRFLPSALGHARSGRESTWTTGGASFHKMGTVEPYRTANPAEGRIAVTGRDADRFNFKVPTIRNVELTYPYFHDGAAATLKEISRARENPDAPFARGMAAWHVP